MIILEKAKMKRKSRSHKNLDIDINAFAEVQQKFKEYNKVHFEKILITNEDELYKYLSKHLKYIKKGRGWIAPLSILITIVAVFSTSTFKSSFGLNPDTWPAIFVIIGVISFIWFVLSMMSVIKERKSKEIENIVKDIITELKNSHQTRA